MNKFAKKKLNNIKNSKLIGKVNSFKNIKKKTNTTLNKSILSKNNFEIIEFENYFIDNAKENFQKKLNEKDDIIECKNKKYGKYQRKVPKKIILYSISSSLIFVLLIILYNLYYEIYIVSPIPSVTNVSITDDNKLSIKFDIPKYKKYKDIYCLFKEDESIPSSDDKNWVLSENNECSTLLSDIKTFAFLKNNDDKIIAVKKSSDLGKIIDFKLNKEQVYIAVNGKYSLKTDLKFVGNIDETITWYSENDKIATVDKNGQITGISLGNTVIHAKISNIDVSSKVMVTDLIVSKPKKYNNKKRYLPCGKYNKEQNDLLDIILKDRINDAGYKTRAGAVEAARFLALEFPYKIRYFSENGRGSTNGVDGEGRYYHVGLYLDESRFENIGKKMHGPETWGCSLYSNPSHGNRSNGLDCSGFISWAMLNGGFDVGDIGAGLAPHLDLTDYGDRIDFNENVIKSGKVKVGDLLSSGGVNGGHIAMIVGEDDKYYYVAESLWTPPNVAVVIIGYDKKTIFNRYYYVMLMDSYYKEDGNLTSLWY